MLALVLLVAACAEPDPRQLLVEMRDALREVETVRYQMSLRGTGDRAADTDARDGKVTLRRLDLSGGRYLARLETQIERADGSTDQIVGGRSEEQVVLLRASDRLARKSSIYEAGSSLLAWMDSSFLYVVYDPESLRDEIEAETVLWEGGDEVAGEPCDLVRVAWADEEEDARWCIGEDRLPRRLEWISSSGSTVLEAFELEVDPEVSTTLFSPPIPEDYTVEELRIGPAPGTPPPLAAMLTSSGATVGLEDLAGQVVVLDFWATWCPPCLASLAGLDRLAEAYAGEPVGFFAVNAMEDPSSEPVRFFDQRGYSSELLLEGDEVHAFYARGSLPGNAVLDSEGKLVGVSIGYHGEGSERRLKALIDLALAAER